MSLDLLHRPQPQLKLLPIACTSKFKDLSSVKPLKRICQEFPTFSHFSLNCFCLENSDYFTSRGFFMLAFNGCSAAIQKEEIKKNL